MPEDARVFLVTVKDALGGVQPIDRSELQKNDRVSIFGVEGDELDDCFVAETVISFGDDPDIAPLPSLDSGGVGAAVTTSAYVSEDGEDWEGEAESADAAPDESARILPVS